MKVEIKPVYATYEQSKTLMEKWFDVKVNGFYNGAGFLNVMYHFEDSISAPEQWQVVEWFRVVHGIWITVYPKFTNLKDSFGYFQCEVHTATDGLKKRINWQNKKDYSPQEAYSAGIDYVLKTLIK